MLDEASALGQSILEKDPMDFKTRSQLEWVCHDRLKLLVASVKSALQAGGRPDERDLRKIDDTLREFSNLPGVQIPGMACSKILQTLSSIAPHFPQFGLFVRWVRDDGLRPEDWKPNEYNGKTYPAIAALVARGFAKWVRAHAADDPGQVLDAVRWLQLARQHDGPNPEWLDWDLALMLRLQGDHTAAASCLATVLKSKRNEFWVWAEAGRLYASEQPELARACFCRALSCPAEDGFTVNVHVDLAALLAELEEFAQASRETAAAIAIRESRGWKIPTELQALIDSPWYDPDASAAVEPKAFYARHAAEALVLCFDDVEMVPGTYLGTILPKHSAPPPGWKPRPLPRFAVRDSAGKVWSLVGPGMRVRHLSPGDPVSLVRGTLDGRQTIVQVAPRADGSAWDCLDTSPGIFLGASGKDAVPHVFVDRDNGFVKVGKSAAEHMGCLQPGDSVKLRLAFNPKHDRVDVVTVEPGQWTSHPDIQQFSGSLKRHPNGFAFVEDIFVAPPLLNSLPADAERASGIAVYGRKPKRDDYGWSAVTVRPE